MNDAYTAGIIDGEGTITIANQDGYYYLRVNVTMSDKGYRVLDFLHREYGGMMGKERPSSGNTRASKQWRVSNGDAARVINSVLSHLRLKREQALVALQLWDLIEEAPKKSNGRTEWSDSMKASAEVLKRRMGELNARGVNGPEPQVVHEGAVAVWKYGEWHEPEDDLFGPVTFKGRLPVSGSMRNGVAYELPTSAHHTDGSGSLFSQLGGKIREEEEYQKIKLLHTPDTTPGAGNKRIQGWEGPQGLENQVLAATTTQMRSCQSTETSQTAHLSSTGSPGKTLSGTQQQKNISVEGSCSSSMCSHPTTSEARLLKTPTAQLAVNGGSQHPDKRKAGGHGPTLADEVEHLLPTPKAGDADFGMPRTSGRPPEKSTHLMTRRVHTLPDRLLPTPNTMEHLPARTGEARERQLRRGEGPDASRRQSMGNLREDIVEVEPGEWGPYAAAIAQWEAVLGRPAPAPTEEGPKGGRRLSAAFVEWMMGLPEGWVTGHGLPRTAELKMLGNGCVPQQVIMALNSMRAARSINEGETK